MKTIVKILFVVAVLWSLAFIFKLGNSFAASNNACSYEDAQILEIGKKSEAYQRSRFTFAGKHCNLNAKARGDK